MPLLLDEGSAAPAAPRPGGRAPPARTGAVRPGSGRSGRPTGWDRRRRPAGLRLTRSGGRPACPGSRRRSHCAGPGPAAPPKRRSARAGRPKSKPSAAGWCWPSKEAAPVVHRLVDRRIRRPDGCCRASTMLAATLEDRGGPDRCGNTDPGLDPAPCREGEDPWTTLRRMIMTRRRDAWLALETASIWRSRPGGGRRRQCT